MASLMKRGDSPYWWIRHKDKQGKWVQSSTGLRRDDQNDTAKAHDVLAKIQKREAANSARQAPAAWSRWVIPYLERHSKSEKTLLAYKARWKWLHMWLSEEGIHFPRAVRYKHALAYVEWRSTYVKRTGRSVSRNTAITEIKLLAFIMNEAVRLEFAENNPLAHLDIPRSKPKEKPEIFDDEIAVIRRELENEKWGDWMRLCFEVGLNTGLRLSECRLEMNKVDLNAKTITVKPKGGEKRTFSIPIPEAILPILEEAKASGRSHLFDFPFQPSRKWQHFFHMCGLDHLTFHSLRVTYATRLFRAGVRREAAMRLMNHADELVHRIYTRLGADDVRADAALVAQLIPRASGDAKRRNPKA